jgi:hypothetical protein
MRTHIAVSIQGLLVAALALLPLTVPELQALLSSKSQSKEAKAAVDHVMVPFVDSMVSDSPTAINLFI